MNRNVSIWRGNEFPPTTKHVWIDDENNFLLHDGSGWRIVINTDGNDDELINAWIPTSNMNDFINSGTYKIEGERTGNYDNLPIINQGVISARLEVFETESNDNKVITLVLNLNNNAGGEGNVYIRSKQGHNWKPWGKLLTNVEVGLIGVGLSKTFDDLIDNGIYSGVNAYWTDQANYVTSAETFVLVVINAYLYGGDVSQLKYSLLLDGTTSVMTRSKRGNVWNEWSNLGNKTTLGTGLRYDDNGAISLVLGSSIGVDVDGNLDVLLGSGLTLDPRGAIIPVLGSGLSFDYIGQLIKLSLSTGLTDLDGSLGIQLDNQDGMNSSGLEKTYYGLRLKSAATVDGQHVAPIVMLGSSKTYGIEVADTIDDTPRPVMSKAVTAVVEEGEKRVLRRLFVAAGAEYNDSGADKEKTAPWGETVIHKAGHYYLNGLGDITEEQMVNIYNAGKITSKEPMALYSKVNIRTTLKSGLNGGEASGISYYYLCNGNKNIETFCATTSNQSLVNNMHASFVRCNKLTHILPVLDIRAIVNVSNLSRFVECYSLTYCKLMNLKVACSFLDSPNIGKESILFIIQNATPTSAITITLHPDAYARLADDAELVTALETKNAELATSGGSISIVSA